MPAGTLKENWAISLRKLAMSQVKQPPTAQGTRTVEIKPGGKP
jgi:hypothetical protein